MKQPRLAEIVASRLRESIVGGELRDGDSLPTLDRLVEEFEVSPPSVREALRILEHEGLITVRRGNVGGAIVHRPKAESAAYMLGLVLQSQRVKATDLAQALRHLEPLCASLCARRDDRNETVVPVLAAALRRTATQVDDPPAFSESSKAFHGGLVDLCGNDTLILVASSLASLWSAQDVSWPRRIKEWGESPGREQLARAQHEHEQVLEAIADGDVERTEKLMREHVEDPDIYGIRHSGVARIRATDLRPG